MDRPSVSYLFPLFAWIACLAVAGAGSASPYQEIGGEPPPPQPPASVPAEEVSPVSLDPLVEILGGVQTFMDEDLADTYSVLPSIGAGMSWRLGASSRVRVTAAYAQADGDPYYATPEFDGPSSRVRVVPVTVGVSTDLNPRGSLHLDVGCAFQTAWMEEHVPLADGFAYASGVLFGLDFTGGHRWSLDRGRKSVSLELGWGGTGGRVRAHGDHYDADLRGFHARIVYAFRLHDGRAFGEVQ